MAHEQDPQKDVKAVKDVLITNNPVMTFGKGLAKVGEHVSRGYETVKKTAKEYFAPAKKTATKRKSTSKSMSSKR